MKMLKFTKARWEEEKCNWTEIIDVDCGDSWTPIYTTTCGHHFQRGPVFTTSDDVPMKYCPFCGLEINFNDTTWEEQSSG